MTTLEQVQHYNQYLEGCLAEYERKIEQAETVARIEAKREANFTMMDAASVLKDTREHIMKEYGEEHMTATVSIAMMAGMSKDVLDGDFRQFKGENQTFDEALGMYEVGLTAFGPFIDQFMPNMLTYDEMMTVCGESFVDIEITATCPACGSKEMKVMGVMTSMFHHGHFIGFECKDCCFSPIADVTN